MAIERGFGVRLLYSVGTSARVLLLRSTIGLYYKSSRPMKIYNISPCASIGSVHVRS